MSDYIPTIGLEIHAELKTRTKMFCDSANDPDEVKPNVNICPVCLAHPGTLPTINKEAVRHMLRIGTAVSGTLADYTEFDRKSYFYPDIPKGYQISQYEHPLVSGGELAGIAITRVHLEEDTARSQHTGKDCSLVDFNRAGVPLMELVTEPVIHDAETAVRFARELQLLLRTLEAGDANLEKGEMRIEANISVSKDGTLGTKVEVKNLNSFRAVERAIAYEIKRQSEVLENGGELTQETRGWDEDKGTTFSQRAKEGAADYRYFPEPDLPKLILSDLSVFAPETLKAGLPELPWERRARYASYGITADDAQYLASTKARADFFDAVAVSCGEDAALLKKAANYIVSDIAGWYAKQKGGAEFGKLTPESFVELMRMVATNEVSSRGAKDILTIMLEEGGEPRAVADERGLLQVSDDSALSAAVDQVLTAHASVADEYRGGKESALMFLVGQVMKETKGAGNPVRIKELLTEKLA